MPWAGGTELLLPRGIAGRQWQQGQHRGKDGDNRLLSQSPDGEGGCEGRAAAQGAPGVFRVTCSHLEGREQQESAGPKGFLLLGAGK